MFSPGRKSGNYSEVNPKAGKARGPGRWLQKQATPTRGKRVVTCPAVTEPEGCFLVCLRMQLQGCRHRAWVAGVTDGEVGAAPLPAPGLKRVRSMVCCIQRSLGIFHVSVIQVVEAKGIRARGRDIFY